MKDVRAPKFSWIRPSILWRTRNDKIAFHISDPTDDERRRWIAERCVAGRERDFLMSHFADKDEVSFLLMGDTGEGDASQYVTLPPLYASADGIDFTVIASDVNYPIGDVNDYLDKFYRPYKDLPGPIYAIPGNHDWYDNLNGFMLALCVAQPLEEDRSPKGFPFSRKWLRRTLWRKPHPTDEELRGQCLAFRAEPGEGERQPGPYWALDAGPVRLIGIDTGIRGNIDSQQGAWLRRVAAGPKPKILITGKPIYVNNEYVPGPIEDGSEFVDDIVREPENNFIAAIGGDTHNYQRYPVHLDGRTIQYIVSGGGGAYMHATHRIPKVDVRGVQESEFRCYPLRGDSLAFYSRVYARRLRRFPFAKRLELEPDEAASLLAESFGTTATRGSAQQAEPSKRARRAFKFLSFGWLPMGKFYQRYFSEFSDVDDPPLFKSFLRVDIGAQSVRIRCFAATGCAEHESSPPVEDDVTWEGAWMEARPAAPQQPLVRSPGSKP
jgi:hypothetical protein